MEQLQIALFDMYKSDIEKIKQAMVTAIDDSDFSAPLNVEPLMNKDQVRGISIKARNLVVAYVEYKKKSTSFLKIRVSGMKFFPESSIDRVDEEWLYINFDNIQDVIAYAPQMAQVYMSIMKTFALEAFGCCSRYLECSDAMHCVHPNKVKAEACQYKTNLEHGRVFYGKNRNV